MIFSKTKVIISWNDHDTMYYVKEVHTGKAVAGPFYSQGEAKREYYSKLSGKYFLIF